MMGRVSFVACHWLPLASGAPVVSITASPGSVNNSGSFTAVASDDDNTEAEIQVRWDWENDGTWDTDWSATKTATHAYTSVGDKTLAVAAKDKFGVTASVTKAITIVSYFLSDFAMLPVAGGSFTSSDGTVNVSSFTMSATEITQAQYKAVTGDSPSYFSTVTGGPVEQVTWYDAVEFCNLLSAKEGRILSYAITARSPATGYPITSATVTMDKTKNGYRLPTDAEWEFTAQGGTKTKSYTYSGSNDVGTVAWYSSNASSTTHPVGTKTANELGLFDMSGNVWEWCWDWWGGSLSGTDPTGPSTGSNCVIRGGSWITGANLCTVSYRNAYSPDVRYIGGGVSIGFRVLAP